ncbi:DUF3570 domain-containing protein [Agaribacterium haliotis]|uniref:DUF3570 domain-containing protein n=1 Tax=Agaribacterium haliotis TaxID=2013869 RepID=UPI001EFE6B34|nr:DUF3570 domain-containing protein [Agaribacterium haliotis]
MVVTRLLCLLAALFLSVSASATVLPEDQSEVLYHRYQGGGITIDGPSVLVRKGFKDKVSVWGNYYTDNISGASIDLLAQGSSYYEEHRTETSVGADYLHGRTIMSLSGTNSSERDYEANSFAFGLSQAFFGDMSTLSLSYSQGNDDVRENIYEDGSIVDTIDRGKARHQRYGLGLSQIITRKLIVSFNAETVVDDGFLNNPYRWVRYLDGENLGREKEKYPASRNSDAFALRAMYYLPYRAALKAEYRIFSDSWGIEASNWELRYIHPWRDWIFEAKYRAYEQGQADFYSDLFPYADAQEYLARDKELSEFSDSTLGLGFSYDWDQKYLSWADKTTLNFYWDYINFDYHNFRENTPENTSEYGSGNEPFYSFGAHVVRAFISVAY